MILELSKKTFEELEIYKDLYPYEYDTNNKDLTNTLTRLIFKAFNHGKMSGSRTILNKINMKGGILIKDIELFDIYQNISEDRKSLAFHIIYQAENRTLLSEEVDKIQQEIIKILETDPEWEVRK